MSNYYKSDTKLDINGKPLNVYIASPSEGGPGILVLPSWWGLKPSFKQVCDRLAERGYTALAPDYYDGRIGTSIEETQALQQAVEGDLDAMVAIIKSAKDHLVLLRPGQPIGLIGFSMGTDWAVMTAAKAQDVAATVLFYGGFTTDFSQMKSSVLGHYAEKDEWVPFEQAINMEQAMKAADVDVTLYYYPGTAHWFMEEDRPEYDPAAASRVVGMPYWASHGVRHRLWETISQRELQVTCYARCHRSGLLASRITTLLASRSSWTHFIHFANEINHHIPVTHSWQ